MAFVVIDGGTTNTRLFLVEDGKISGKVKRSVGVRDTSLSGDNTKLKRELLSAFEEIKANTTLAIEKAIALGMITSPLGLHNVPHVPAPIGAGELAQAIFWQDQSSSFIGVPLGFVPGVKTHFSKKPASWDLMRGEETLTFGLLEKFKPAGPVLVINLGSHTKFIGVDAKGVITGSLTTLAGELIAALKAQTVLASSLPFELPSTGKPNFQRVLAGASLAEEAGLLRSAFVVRVLDQLIGLLPEECFDFLSGAVAASDLEALTSWQGNEYAQVFLLGNPYRTAIYAELLSHKGAKNINIISEAELDEITVAGAIKLIEGD